MDLKDQKESDLNAGELVIVDDPGGTFHSRSGKFIRYDKNNSAVMWIDFREIYILKKYVKRLH